MLPRRSPPGIFGLMLPIGLAAAAFIIDLQTPNGVLDGFPYVFAVFACQWTAGANASLLSAVALMPVMVLGFWLSPGGGPIEVACLHRFVAMVVIAVAAIASWRQARVLADREAKMSHVLRQLETVTRASATERAGLSQWLRNTVDTELDVVEWRLSHFWKKEGQAFDPLTESFVLRRTVQRIKSSVRRQQWQLLTSDPAQSSMACGATSQ